MIVIWRSRDARAAHHRCRLGRRAAPLLDGLGRLNIFTAPANRPALLRKWLVFGGHVLPESTLPPRVRELVILRAGRRCRSPYEFAQHRVLGAQARLAPAEISRLASEDLTEWASDDRLLVRAVDQLVCEHRLDTEVWDGLVVASSLQQVMDLVFTVGQYVLVSMALNAEEVGSPRLVGRSTWAG